MNIDRRCCHKLFQCWSARILPLRTLCTRRYRYIRIPIYLSQYRCRRQHCFLYVRKLLAKLGAHCTSIRLNWQTLPMIGHRIETSPPPLHLPLPRCCNVLGYRAQDKLNSRRLPYTASQSSILNIIQAISHQMYDQPYRSFHTSNSNKNLVHFQDYNFLGLKLKWKNFLRNLNKK